MNEKKLIEIITKRMNEKHMSNRSLAEKIGCHFNTIHYFLTGKQSIRTAFALKMCEALDLEIKIEKVD